MTLINWGALDHAPNAPQLVTNMCVCCTCVYVCVCVCVNVCTCVGACVCAHAVIHSITVNTVTELKSVVIQLYMYIESHQLSEKQSQRLH